MRFPNILVHDKKFRFCDGLKEFKVQKMVPVEFQVALEICNKNPNHCPNPGYKIWVFRPDPKKHPDLTGSGSVILGGV